MKNLGPNDVALLRSAYLNLAQAQATLDFIKNHLSVVYGLAPTDQLNVLTGEITNAENEVEHG